MTLQDEIHQQLHRAGTDVPWMLKGNLAGRPLEADEISTDELVHGLAIMIIELVRVCERLAGEIDKLRAAE